MYTAILLLAGSSSRFGSDKCFIKVINKPLFLYSLEVFYLDNNCNQIILVTNSTHFKDLKEYENQKVQVITGGTTRNKSVKKALPLIKNDLFLIHDAARPNLCQEDIDLMIAETKEYDGLYLANKTVNTLRTNQNMIIDRDNIYQVLTPQLFKKETIPFLLNNEVDASDEIAILENNFKIKAVITTHQNPKLTYPDDLLIIKSLLIKEDIYKIGFSYDFHPFKEGNHLILGGITIPFNKEVEAISDGDVLLHAITEAIFGSLNSGDLGEHYKMSDPKNKGRSSLEFLNDAKNELIKSQYKVANIDTTIYLEKPHLKGYKSKMKEKIAAILQIPSSLISIKATTLEKRGLVGCSEGIAVEAHVLIKKEI